MPTKTTIILESTSTNTRAGTSRYRSSAAKKRNAARQLRAQLSNSHTKNFRSVNTTRNTKNSSYHEYNNRQNKQDNQISPSSQLHPWCSGPPNELIGINNQSHHRGSPNMNTFYNMMVNNQFRESTSTAISTVTNTDTSTCSTATSTASSEYLHQRSSIRSSPGGSNRERKKRRMLPNHTSGLVTRSGSQSRHHQHQSLSIMTPSMTPKPTNILNYPQQPRFHDLYYDFMCHRKLIFPTNMMMKKRQSSSPSIHDETRDWAFTKILPPSENQSSGAVLPSSSHPYEQQAMHRRPQHSPAQTGFTDVSYLERGRFSIIFSCKHQKIQNNALMCVKIITKSKTNYEEIQNEIMIHSRLKHRNIVQFYGFFHDKRDVYICMELSVGSNLAVMMNQLTLNRKAPEGSHSSLMPLDLVASYTKQLAGALNYLHSNGCYHRDIKPQNVLLYKNRNEEQFSVVKLCDFGSAIHTPPGDKNSWWRHTMCGIPEYVPIELVKYTPQSYNHNATKKTQNLVNVRMGSAGAGRSNQSDKCNGGDVSDIDNNDNCDHGPSDCGVLSYDVRRVDAWSLGVLICNMIMGGRGPFTVSKFDKHRKKILKGYLSAKEVIFNKIRAVRVSIRLTHYTSALSDHVDFETELLVCDLVKKLTYTDPHRRIKMIDVLHHEWISRS
jgi:serine/threonine protein kinase